MALFLVTPPAVQPLSLAEAKAHCRVEVDTENALLTSLIAAATTYVENYTNRALITQTWDEKREYFPDGRSYDSYRNGWYFGGRMVLPKPPVSAITSVVYTNTNGDSTTWASSLYTKSLPVGDFADPAEIEPIYGGIYPITLRLINAVTIRFVCGYGTTGADVPAQIKAAMKLLIAHWFDHREPVNIGGRVIEIPDLIAPLLWPFKVLG